MIDSIKRATLGQIAMVDLGVREYREGSISMISKRGVNIDTEHGTVFVKWHNVIKIKSDEKCKCPQGSLCQFFDNSEKCLYGEI